MDYILAALKKPYVAILDGITSVYYCFIYISLYLTLSGMQWVVVLVLRQTRLFESPQKRLSLGCLKRRLAIAQMWVEVIFCRG